MISVCLCTHSPRPGTLRLAIGSLARQSSPPGTFEVLVVDSGSEPPLAPDVLAPLAAAGIPARMVREVEPGLTRARLRAIGETRRPWLLLLDDDNELRADYVDEATRFIAARPDVGCFGGKLLLPETFRPPPWAWPFYSWMAIKDAGDDLITGSSNEWGLWEPPGAGAFVRRDVAEEFRGRFGDDPRLFRLGRRGKRILASCEDSLMMRQARRLGLLNAYHPALVLRHHVDPSRFRLKYLLRLMYAYGTSLVELELLVEGRTRLPEYYRGLHRLYKTARRELKERHKTSTPFAIAKILFHWRARATYLRLARMERAEAARSEGSGAPGLGGST